MLAHRLRRWPSNKPELRQGSCLLGCFQDLDITKMLILNYQHDVAWMYTWQRNNSYYQFYLTVIGPVLSYKLRYIVAFGLVEMSISTNAKPPIYRNLYGNMGPGETRRKESKCNFQANASHLSKMINQGDAESTSLDKPLAQR